MPQSDSLPGDGAQRTQRLLPLSQRSLAWTRCLSAIGRSVTCLPVTHSQHPRAGTIRERHSHAREREVDRRRSFSRER
jgi:hypothetical protein